MAEVIHTIKGNEYLYEHTRDGEKVVCEYIGPVGKGGKVRKAQHGGGAPLKVTQQTDIQKNEGNINKGNTLNSMKDNSSVGQEKPKEKATMNEMEPINNRYDGIARIKVKNINADIDKHNKLVKDSEKYPNITDKMVSDSKDEITNAIKKAKKSMDESDDRRALAKSKKTDDAKSKIESPARKAVEYPIPKTTSTEMQYQRSNGTYADATPGQKDDMIKEILKRESWYAERVGRRPMTTKGQVITRLQSGESLGYGNDWYQNIRIAKPLGTKAESDAFDEMERKADKKLYELDHDIY